LRLLFRPRTLLALVVILMFVLSLVANFLQIAFTQGVPDWAPLALAIVLGVALLAGAIGWMMERAPHLRLLRDTLLADRDFSNLHALWAVVECEWLRAMLDLDRHRIFEIVRLRIEHTLLSDSAQGFDAVAGRWVASERDPDNQEKRPIIELTDW